MKITTVGIDLAKNVFAAASYPRRSENIQTALRGQLAEVHSKVRPHS
jgi:hypothetical protein